MKVRCQIEGVLESVCVPIEELKSEVTFCYNDLYPYVCMHMYHPLWSFWTVKEKDFEIRTRVSLNAEQRLMQELTQNTFSDEFTAVAGLELTSDTACLNSYKQFMCRYNFPLCDPITGEVFPVCLQDCYNAYENCGNAPDNCDNPLVYRNVGSESTACDYSEE